MLRGAIIGFGTIAAGHLEGYRGCPQLAVTAVVDPSPARRAAAERAGLRAFPELAALLAADPPDFLDVCSPPSSHAEYLLAAARHGIPALCEKPVFVPGALGYAELLAALQPALIYPCQNYKFAPVFNEAGAILRSGRIGALRHVRFDITRSGHARGVADWQPDWRRDAAVSGGGILRDHGPHGIYLATSLTGLRPRSISALLGSLRAGWDTEDTAMARLVCDGGADIELRLTWAAGFRDSRYLFVGSRGYLSIDNDVMCWSADGERRELTVRSDFDDPTHRSWFAAMFADFQAVLADRARHRERLAALVAESVLTSRIIDAGYRSAALGGSWLALADQPDGQPEALDDQPVGAAGAGS